MNGKTLSLALIAVSLVLSFKGAGMLFPHAGTMLLSCSDQTTNICDYQTLLTGLSAIVAALVAGYFVSRQTYRNARSYSLQLRIGNLQSTIAADRQAFAVASAISSDIASMIERIEDSKHREGLLRQVQEIKDGRSHGLYSFPITCDYFTVFDAMIKDIGVLPYPFPYRVCEWYSRGKGFVDTIQGINGGFYKDTDIMALTMHQYNELCELIKSGRVLAHGLVGFAAKRKMEIGNCQTLVESYLDADEKISI